jgi:hypothetical protein
MRTGRTWLPWQFALGLTELAAAEAPNPFLRTAVLGFQWGGLLEVY